MTPSPLTDAATAALLTPQVFTAAVTGVLAIVAVAFEGLRRSNRDLKRVAEETRYEVKNDHSTNMRADLDRIMTGVDVLLEASARHEQALAGHGVSIGGLRDDIRQERDQRMGDVEHLRESQLNINKRLDKHIDNVI